MGGRDELVELLGRAGLEVVGDRRVEEVLPPRAAWRQSSRSRDRADRGRTRGPARPGRRTECAVAPAGVRARESSAGTASSSSTSRGDGTGCAPRRWTRVRLTGRLGPRRGAGRAAGAAGVPHPLAGRRRLVGATTEEYDVWLIAVDRLRERQEEPRRRRRGEPAGAGGRLGIAAFEPGPRPSGRLRESWAHGLALNPSTPMICAPGSWACRMSCCGAPADGGGRGRHGPPGLEDAAVAGRASSRISRPSSGPA